MALFVVRILISLPSQRFLFFVRLGLDFGLNFSCALVTVSLDLFVCGLSAMPLPSYGEADNEQEQRQDQQHPKDVADVVRRIRVVARESVVDSEQKSFGAVPQTVEETLLLDV